MASGTGAASLVALSVVEPSVGGDNGVWGNELNVIISQMQTTINNLITVVQTQDSLIQTLQGGSTGLTSTWA